MSQENLSCGEGNKCKWFVQVDDNPNFGVCKRSLPQAINGTAFWPQIKSTERACYYYDNSKDGGLRSEVKKDKKQTGGRKVLENNKKSVQK